jgi:hypothetical protein
VRRSLLTIVHENTIVRIGMYVDGYNLYYGGRGLCGRGKPGWRWLDLRSLADRLVAQRSGWAGVIRLPEWERLNYAERCGQVTPLLYDQVLDGYER